MNYVLYNPLASAGKGKENFEAAKPDIDKDRTADPYRYQAFFLHTFPNTKGLR